MLTTENSHRQRMLGTLAASLTLAAMLGTPTLGHASTAHGGSCARPSRATFTLTRRGNLNSFVPHGSNPIGIGLGSNGRPWRVDWYVRTGYVVCSVRILLRNGTLARPTRLFPYATPTPIGGEYEETANPNSRFHSVEVLAAKSPVPLGASCNYPLESRANVDASHSGDTKDFTVDFLYKSPTEVELGEPLTLQLKATVLNPARVELCPRARIGVWVRSSEVPRGARPLIEYHVSVPPGGGLSSVVTIRRGEALVTNVYARLKK